MSLHLVTPPQSEADETGELSAILNRQIKSEPKDKKFKDKKIHPAVKVELPPLTIKQEPEDRAKSKASKSTTIKTTKSSGDELRKVKKEEKFKKSKKITSRKELVKMIKKDSSLPKVLLHRIKSPKSKTAKVQGSSASYEIAKWILSDGDSDEEEFQNLLKRKKRKKRFLIDDSEDEASDNENDDDVQIVASFSQSDVCIEISDDDEYLINSQLASIENIKEEPNDSGRDDSSDNEQESMLEQIYSQQIEDEDNSAKAKKAKKTTKNLFDDESDEEDKNIEDESSSESNDIPSLDDEEPEDEKPKKKKPGSKRRLSDEEIRKQLDSDDSEDQQPIIRKKARTESKDVKKSKSQHPVDVDNRRLTPAQVENQLVTSTADDHSNSKQAKLIDALPQPPRFAKLRGISENTLKDLHGPKDDKPSCSKWLSSRKPNTKRASDFKEKPAERSSEPKKDIKTLRKEKLEQLALKGKHEKEGKVEEEAQPVSKPKANFKRSEPKISNFLQQSLECKPKRKRVSRLQSNDVSEPMQIATQSKENSKGEGSAMDVEENEAVPKVNKPSKKTLRWIDSDGTSPLQQVRFIERENRGMPITKENLAKPLNQEKLLPIPMDLPPNVQPAMGPPIYRTEGMYEKILNWATKWLEEQKKLAVAPPVFDERPLKLKTNTFASYKGKKAHKNTLVKRSTWIFVFILNFPPQFHKKLIGSPR